MSYNTSKKLAMRWFATVLEWLMGATIALCLLALAYSIWRNYILLP